MATRAYALLISHIYSEDVRSKSGDRTGHGLHIETADTHTQTGGDFRPRWTV